MQKIHFEISIQADPEKVWDAVVEDKKYREWTAVFSPGSYFEGSWEKGEKIYFIGVNENGLKEGMVAEIAENKKYSFISIRHLGYFKGGTEDTTSEAVKSWVPAYENYTFRKMGEETKFEVDVDVEDKYLEMFQDLWPNALKKLKEIAER